MSDKACGTQTHENRQASPAPAFTIRADSEWRSALFGNTVLCHPAKQNIFQLAHLLDRAMDDWGIAPGSTLIDVFGGSGTAMLACAPAHGGFNVFTVELAQRFLEVECSAWAHFQKTQFFRYQLPQRHITTPGDYLPLHADSRDLVSVEERLAKWRQRTGKNYGATQGSSWRSYDSPDLIITSPPYQDAYGAHSQVAVGARYDKQAENIGNQRGDKYLASMRLVWQQCALILKPGGVLCCITRDCVQHGKRVPVGEQNRELIEAAGLTFLECENWQLTQESFWRKLQRKDAERKGKEPIIIDSEQVWIFRKPELEATA